MPSNRGPSIIGALSLVALGLLTQLQVDNRHEQLLDHTGPAARAYERFQEQFGSDSILIVGISGKPLFEYDGLDTMVVAMERIADSPYVANVSGIPKIYRDTFEQADAELLEEEMTSTPFYEGLFISSDHSVAGLLVELHNRNEKGAAETIAEHVDAAVQPLRDYGYRVDLVGDPIFTREINRLTQGESSRMFPIAALVSLVALISLVRSLRATAAVLLCGVATLLLTMGAMVATGHTLNLVTITLPLVLWVLSIANGIHIVSRFQRRLALDPDARTAIRITMRELTFSCSLSALTTAFGFLSLMVAGIGAVRDFGMYASMGMVISLIVNLTLTPWLLIKLKEARAASPDRPGNALLERIADRVTRRPVPVIALWTAFIAFAVYSALQVKSDPDTLSLLPQDHPIVQSYEFVSTTLTGTRSMELVIDTPDGWTDPKYWDPIQALSEKLSDIDHVSRVYAPPDFLKKINQWDHGFDPEYYRLPESEERARELLDMAMDEDTRMLDRFVSDSGERVRMSVLIASKNSEVFAGIIAAAESAIEEFPDDMNVTLTGRAVRMEEFTYGLVRTQVRSYGAAFVMVFAAIFIGLRSFRMTLLSILPNIMPLLTVFMLMGQLGISLDVATVMVASISLGIAVDDTVHFLVGYQRHRARGDGNFKAIRETLSHVGPAITVTTATACIGFFTLAFSVFLPIQSFGLLSGVAILVALLADLFFVPAILALAGDRA